LIFSFVSDEEITEADLAELKQKDMLDAAIGELASTFPNVKRYLVDERDQYLAAGIKSAPGDNIVAVVGAAHVDGILANLAKDVDKASLETLKPPSKIGKVIGWGIPIALVAMIAYTLFRDASAGFEQLKKWTLYTSVLASLGTLVGGGHPLSIATSFFLAPFTALHPLLAVGWFAGLTEANVRKPTVGDFESISDDLSRLSGLWRNKVTRILLVVFFANLGGTIGTLLAGVNIINIFRGLFT
jgi:pheromone shutdown-related protein TraB